MNIYEIVWHTGEKSWICANTVIEALKVYCVRKNTDFAEFDGMDDIIVLPKIRWHLYKVNKAQSFYRYMRTAIIPDVIKESFINNIVLLDSNLKTSGLKNFFPSLLPAAINAIVT